MTSDRRGLTLVEVAIVVTVLAIVSACALPAVRLAVKRADEIELKTALRQIRAAIDRHYDDEHKLNPAGIEALKYPKDLETLVAKKYLRRLPEDPLTGKADWRLLSSTDAVENRVTNRDNVWDVRSTADGEAIDGTKYETW